MKKYRTIIKLEVEADSEEQALHKMYELLEMGEIQIDDIIEYED